MKLLFPLLISTLILASACNDRKTPEADPTVSLDTTGSVSNISGQQKEAELEALTSYTPEQMKALLPKELNGGPLKDPTSGEATGTAFARGIYAASDTSVIEFGIFDCGGISGSGFYKYQFLSMLNNAEPTDEGEELKVVDYKGGKAIEQYNANSYQSGFVYMSGRFFVTLHSEFLDVAGLKKIADGLELK